MENISDLAIETYGRYPFILADNLVAFSTADLNADESLLLRLLVASSIINVRNGSTRTPLDAHILLPTFRHLVADDVALPDNLDLLFDLLSDKRTSQLVAEIKPEINIGHIPTLPVTPLFVSQNYIYHQRHYLLEHQLAANIYIQLHPVIPTFSLPADFTNNFPLSNEQHNAVLHALSHPLTIITGGPGTGKTSIIKAIVAYAIAGGYHPHQIAVAAPTGKATQRLSEVLDDANVTPVTLHRLLKFSPETLLFRQNEQFPLREHIIIVDEASMIDLQLMERLFAALPEFSILVLVGDAEQLPSVDAGAVFKELNPPTSTSSPHTQNYTLNQTVVNLTQNFRVTDSAAAQQILEVARFVQNGDYQGILSTSSRIYNPRSIEERSLDGVNLFLLEDSNSYLDTLGDILPCWYRKFVSLRNTNLRSTLLDPIPRHQLYYETIIPPNIKTRLERAESARILCAYRWGSAGTNYINEQLRFEFAKENHLVYDSYSFIPEDLVMMTKNDYRREIFNGETGVVVNASVDDEDNVENRPFVVFRQRSSLKTVQLEAVQQRLEHAFALTIHKSQGSEFDYVAIILPTVESELLSRELLYTAITRCRKGCIIIATPQVLEFTVENVIRRSNGLRDRLLQLLAPQLE